MNKSTFRAVRVTAAAALLALAGAAAVADEAEIFQGVPNSVSSSSRFFSVICTPTASILPRQECAPPPKDRP